MSNTEKKKSALQRRNAQQANATIDAVFGKQKKQQIFLTPEDLPHMELCYGPVQRAIRHLSKIADRDLVNLPEMLSIIDNYVAGAHYHTKDRDFQSNMYLLGMLRDMLYDLDSCALQPAFVKQLKKIGYEDCHIYLHDAAS